jgi:hypothetical protein
VLGHKTSLVAQTLDSKENKQQTAVEWLFYELERIDKVYYRNTIIYTDARKEAFEQAKEMEKERIIAANRDGVDMVVDKKDFISGELYYNKTYGGGEQ